MWEVAAQLPTQLSLVVDRVSPDVDGAPTRRLQRDVSHVSSESRLAALWINLWLSILAVTGGGVGLMLGSVFTIELDAGLAGIYFYGICKWSDTLWPVGSVRLFADYTISLHVSSLCRLICRHWTKMLAWYRLQSVCLRLRQFSQSSFIQYMGLYVFSLPNSPVMIVRVCTLSYYHHQIGSMTH